ncbi:hypothetical protein WEU32_06435 [Brevundimonas sp. BH3]|uniref:hypothetical protein n=1 Tax=Brevundimonas sp. BH3 TaxID=3133089 RepID=UPI00324D8A29
MKRWQRQLDEHPLTSSLAKIEEILSQGISTTDQIQNYEFVRLSKIIKRTKDSIKQLDPEFAPVDQMHSVQNFIINHNIVSQVHDSINNKNYSTLASINNSFDGVMSQINLINKSITRSNSSKIDHAISSSHLQRFIALIAKEQTQMNILYQERQRKLILFLNNR